MLPKVSAALAAVALSLAVATETAGSLTAREENSPVLQLPDVIVAGEETTWTLDLSNNNKTTNHHRKLSLQLAAVSRQLEVDGYLIQNTYCELAPCITRNVSSIALTIPKDAFPPGTSVTAVVHAYESDKERFGTWIGPDTSFVLSGSDAIWSSYEVYWGWGPPGIWLPCEAVSCRRSCMTDHFDRYVESQPSERREAFDSCVVERCGVREDYYYNRDPDANCITSNTHAPPPEVTEEITEPAWEGRGTRTGMDSWALVSFAVFLIGLHMLC